ncbi:MAG TPA: HAMP domain-containing sensor histidine kinase [Limnobacter sp.]|nr:HAMP domain-containing sensor histidine kinase [Limnobacter sp.]
MGFVILGNPVEPGLAHGSHLHAVLMVLSFLFFSSAYLRRKREQNIPNKTAWLPFILAVLLSVVGETGATVQVYCIISVIQASCLMAITIQYGKLPRLTYFKAAYFCILYSIVACVFHLSYSPEYGDLVSSSLLNNLFYLLLGSIIIHMVFQDFSRIRLTSNLDEHTRVDQELMKFAYGSRRVLKDFQHDLRQPLSTLGILASVGKALSQDPEVSARYQHIQTAHKALRNMLEEFFEQLSNAIRYPQVKSTLPLQSVALDDVLGPLIEEYRLLGDVKHLDIRHVPSRVKILTNREALSKIVRNGLDNAVKYTNQGGVVVGLRRKKGKLCIQIVDTGSGVENNKVAIQNKGWGHGANIIRTLSEQIQAKTECRNRYFRNELAGSVFEIILPDDKEVQQREKCAEFSHRTSFNAQVMATCPQQLLEIQKCLPVEGFDRVDFTLNGAYRAYLNALRKGMAPVYIMYVGEPGHKKEGLEQLNLLSSLLDFNPCCILIYNASQESNPRIEFGRQIIQIPLFPSQGASNLSVISELFPNRGSTVKKTVSCAPSVACQQKEKSKPLVMF